MNGQDFLFSISNVDNELIEEADISMTVKNRKLSLQKWLSVVAVICLVVGTIFTVLPKNNKVIYAKEMNYSVFFSGVPDEKVEFMSDFSKYSNNTKVRVMIISYEMENAYQEIYSQSFGDNNIDELLNSYMDYVQKNEENYEIISEKWSDISAKISKINDDMAVKEIEWLETIGATNVEKISYNQYAVTIKIEYLNKIETGHCKYRVILIPEKYNHIEINLNSLIGEYECIGIAHVPLHSSVVAKTDSMVGQRLVIGENNILFGREFVISEAKYEIDCNVDKIDSFYGFDTVDFMFMREELLHLFANEHIIINVSGKENTARLFAGDGYVYLDRGLWGIYKFKSIN